MSARWENKVRGGVLTVGPPAFGNHADEDPAC